MGRPKKLVTETSGTANKAAAKSKRAKSKPTIKLPANIRKEAQLWCKENNIKGAFQSIV